MALKIVFHLLVLQFFFIRHTVAQEVQLVNLLPASLSESSGLISFNGRLLTHLDSGGEAALFEIDTLDGNVLRTVHIKNASNTDWEDIAQDDSYLYIGDFGNNNGARLDLKVYRILKSDYLLNSNDTVSADTIAFSYANQSNFTAGFNNTNFDAEAMIAYGDSLYIFSKNWLTSTCDIYSLSKLPGIYSITKIDSFDSQGLITGASYHEASNQLYFCGYGPPIPFITRVLGFNGFPLNSSHISSVNIQVPVGSSVQIEAITSANNQKLYISSETSALGAASLMLIRHLETFASIQLHKLPPLALYPNPSSSYVHFNKKPEDIAMILNPLGQVLFETHDDQINTEQLKAGRYIILITDKYGHSQSQNSFIVKH